MHSNHDLDLIADLAAGRLKDPAPAEALVATCSECAQAYHSHRIVLEAVALQTPMVLNDFERHQLRTSVWEALEAERRPATKAPARSGTPWWYRVGTVAAALVVVVGVGAVLLGGRGGGGGDTPATQTAGDVVAPTDGFNTYQAPSGGADEQATPETEADLGQAQESAAATSADQEAARLKIKTADLETAAAEFARRAPLSTDPVAESALNCAQDDPAAPAAEILATEPADVGDTPAWFVAFGAGSQVASVNVYADETCDLLYRGE